MIQFFSKAINNRKGFTLVELIVVIAILGVLALIAVPRLGGFQENAKVQTDESNAKMLNNMIQVYYAAIGEYPDKLSDLTTSKENYVATIDVIPAIQSKLYVSASKKSFENYYSTNEGKITLEKQK